MSLTPIERYELAITRLSTRLPYLRALYPRPSVKQRHEISYLETQLAALNNNFAKLKYAQTDAQQYRALLTEHPDDVFLLSALDRAEHAIVLYSSYAPSLQAIAEEVTEER